MKKLILTIICILFAVTLNSQTWTELTAPYDFKTVDKVFSIGDDLYVNVNRGELENLIYKDGEWTVPNDETVHTGFGRVRDIDNLGDTIVIETSTGQYLSYDNGSSWIHELTKDDYNFAVLDIDISENGLFVISNKSGDPIMKYNFSEKEWNRIDSMRTDTIAPLITHELESNSTHLFALQNNTVHPQNDLDTLEGGLYISDDKGSSWNKTLVDSSLYSMLVTDDYILVNTVYGNILRSEDNGKTWSESNDIESVITHYTLESDRILASTNPLGIMESRDDGKTWSALKNTIIQSELYKSEGKYFFYGFSNFAYETDTDFTSINHTNLYSKNIRINDFYSIEDTLYSVGSFRRGVLYSTDLGDSWQTKYPELEKKSEIIYGIKSKDNQLYLKTTYAMYSSTDYGVSFDYHQVGSYVDLEIFDDRLIFYAQKGIFISSDYGETFKLSDTTELKFNYKIMNIAKTSEGKLLAFTQRNGVFASDDKADSWYKYSDIAIEEEYTTFNNFYEFEDKYYVVNTYPIRVLESKDKGKTWNEFSIEKFEGLNNYNIEMIDYDTWVLSIFQKDRNDIGIWITNDQGTNWTQVENGLSTLDKEESYYTIVSATSDHIYIEKRFWSSNITNESKLFSASFESLGITTSVENETERKYLYTYPNPATNTVNIDLTPDQFIKASKSEIRVYDIIGNEINTNDEIKIENNKVVWDCSTKPSGVYFIKINEGIEQGIVKVLVE